MITARRYRLPWWLLPLALVVVVACDSVYEIDQERLVVEAFVDTGSQLPPVTVRRTVAIDASFDDADEALVTDARVDLLVSGQNVRYRPTPGFPGQYEPPTSALGIRPEPGESFELLVEWNGHKATASGRTPSRIAIDSVRIDIPDEPVDAVLLDSLQLDSLAINATRGFLYPVQTTVWWSAPEVEVQAEDYWVQAQVRPYVSFSSLILDLFLVPEQVFREAEVDIDAYGRRAWKGLYAVLVPEADSPLPPHDVRVALLRSGLDYARFASSRNDPARREPVSNVTGGLGAVAGVSIDSLILDVTTAGLSFFSTTTGRNR